MKKMEGIPITQPGAGFEGGRFGLTYHTRAIRMPPLSTNNWTSL